jgi:hypothetical protein
MIWYRTYNTILYYTTVLLFYTLYSILSTIHYIYYYILLHIIIYYYMLLYPTIYLYTLLYIYILLFNIIDYYILFTLDSIHFFVISCYYGIPHGPGRITWADWAGQWRGWILGHGTQIIATFVVKDAKIKGKKETHTVICVVEYGKIETKSSSVWL